MEELDQKTAGAYPLEKALEGLVLKQREIEKVDSINRELARQMRLLERINQKSGGKQL